TKEQTFRSYSICNIINVSTRNVCRGDLRSSDFYARGLKGYVPRSTILALAHRCARYFVPIGKQERRRRFCNLRCGLPTPTTCIRSILYGSHKRRRVGSLTSC